MDEYIKSSIDVRKNGFFDLYEINDASIKSKIDKLFAKIEEFGKKCTDVADFEAKFAVSELNSEYMKLFTEIGAKCQMKTPLVDDMHVKSDKEEIMDEVKDQALFQAEQASMPARRVINKGIARSLKDIPIVGDLVHDDTAFVGTAVDFAKDMTKKKRKK